MFPQLRAGSNPISYTFTSTSLSVSNTSRKCHPPRSIPLYALPIQLNLDRDTLGPPPLRRCGCGRSNLLHVTRAPHPRASRVSSSLPSPTWKTCTSPGWRSSLQTSTSRRGSRSFKSKCQLSGRPPSAALSPVSAMYEMLNISRSVAVLRCLAGVRGLRTHIQISNESQLRDITSASESRCQCPLTIRTSIALRRRDYPTRICT
ncbi:hypothetical protein C8R45DRAFT_1204262 [Mycena sanguinolenta]|nr:hypothetical protein C8R45DRAFT_1204262 [Mycena sanguinolenta]